MLLMKQITPQNIIDNGFIMPRPSKRLTLKKVKTYAFKNFSQVCYYFMSWFEQMADMYIFFLEILKLD